MTVRVSPGRIGFDSPTGAFRTATENMPGSWVSSVTLRGVLDPTELRTTKSMELTSRSSNGTSALICPGDTMKSGAATPPKSTSTSEPGSLVGIGGPLAETVTVEKFWP
jgi:Leu/Phe-tRNA-protein transferase